MTPYVDFTYFGLLLYIVVPTLILGFFGWAAWRWALFATAVTLIVQYQRLLPISSGMAIREIWIAIGFAVWQLATLRALAAVGAQRRAPFYSAVAVSLLPLATVKLLPVLWPGTEIGFLGISYVAFRALDVLFCLHDNVITAPRTLDLLGFFFFFPTISSGPIDRYRRFVGDWRKTRTRAEFLRDLDGAVHRIFRGFLYKFILAALIKRYWLDRAANGAGFAALASYMYAYSLYLFFDFAGYSAFAIALSYLFGIRTPENFDRPFLSRNIRDFWNRWHITLSFWFRDHVYMRFLLAAVRGEWFANKQNASVAAYFLSFGLMGLWHGIEPHYIIYGLYQATLLSGFDAFSRLNKERRWTHESLLWRTGSVFLTFHFVCFGFLIFSGHLGASTASTQIGVLERADCEEISGWAWDKHQPDAEVSVNILDSSQYLTTLLADQFRQDLVDAGCGNGRHAFRVTTPKQLKDGRTHHIHVRVAGTRKELDGAPRIFLCP